MFRKRVATAGLVVDDDAYVRAGLGVTLGGVDDPIAELVWSVGVAKPFTGAHDNQIAVETLFGASRAITGAIGAFAAGGVGLDNGFGTPDWRAVVGVRYGDDHRRARTVVDADGDGVADARDRCPQAREDADGFQDADGCPDDDDDGDGVPDASDRCPREAEDKDGFQDADGCPDAPAQLAGHVVDHDGRALARATVTIRQLDAPAKPPIELVSGDDGAFSSALDGGRLEIDATVAGYEPATASASVAPGASASVDVKLVRAVRQGQLRGQVLAFDGKPLAATISVTGATSASATADADGRYSVDLPAGTYQVEVAAPGFTTQHRSVSVRLDGVTVLNVDLRGSK